MNILKRIGNFVLAPVSKAVTVFCILFILAVVFAYYSLDCVGFWSNFSFFAWIILYLASWVQLKRIHFIFERRYPKPQKFFAKPSHPILRILMLLFNLTAVILLFSSCFFLGGVAVLERDSYVFYREIPSEQLEQIRALLRDELRRGRELPENADNSLYDEAHLNGRIRWSDLRHVYRMGKWSIKPVIHQAYDADESSGPEKVVVSLLKSDVEGKTDSEEIKRKYKEEIERHAAVWPASIEDKWEETETLEACFILGDTVQFEKDGKKLQHFRRLERDDGKYILLE